MHLHLAFYVLLDGRAFANTPIEKRQRIEVKVGYDSGEPPSFEEVCFMDIDGTRVYLWHEPCGGIFEKYGLGPRRDWLECGKCKRHVPLPDCAKIIANIPDFTKDKNALALAKAA